MKLQWLEDSSSYFLKTVCLLFFGYTLIVSLMNAWDIYMGKEQNLQFASVAAATILLIVGFVFFFHKLIGPKIFLTVLIVLAFSLRLGWVLWIPTPIESDFSMLYTAAIEATKGDFSFSEKPYFQMWVYQIGFTMYQAFVISIFGESPFILKLLNIFYSVGSVVLVYFIGRVLFNEAAGRVAGLFYATYVSAIVMCSVLTNDHLATFLYLAGFYLLIKTKELSWKKGAVIGLLIGLGNIIRPIGVIILMAVFLYYLVYKGIAMLKADKSARVRTVSSLAAIFAGYFLIMNLVSYSFIAAGVTEYPLSNRAPHWKFVLGLNHETEGWYSNEDASYMGQFPIGEERNEALKALVMERLEDKGQVAILMQKKLRGLWGYRDTAVNWSMSNVFKGELKPNLQSAEHAMYTSLMFLATLTILIAWKRKMLSSMNFLYIVLIGFILIHLLIEIQTRYRFFAIPLIAIIAGGGIGLLVERVRGGVGNKDGK